ASRLHRRAATGAVQAGALPLLKWFIFNSQEGLGPSCNLPFVFRTAPVFAVARPCDSFAYGAAPGFQMRVRKGNGGLGDKSPRILQTCLKAPGFPAARTRGWSSR